MIPYFDEDEGLWTFVQLLYNGGASMTLSTKIDLMKLNQGQNVEYGVREATSTLKMPSEDRRGSMGDVNSEKNAIENSSEEDSFESSDEEDVILAKGLSSSHSDQHLSGAIASKIQTVMPAKKKVLSLLDRVTENRLVKKATQYRIVQSAMEKVSSTSLSMKVTLRRLNGVLAFHILSSPSDRIWFGFKPRPNIMISVEPQVGQKKVVYARITKWIEKKLIQEFEKFLVLPNMDDLYIPFMDINTDVGAYTNSTPGDVKEGQKPIPSEPPEYYPDPPSEHQQQDHHADDNS